MSYADGVRPDGRVDAKRFAEAAGVAYGTVKRWLHEGMPCERIGNRVWIDTEAAIAYAVRRYGKTVAFNRSSLVYAALRHSDGAVKIGFTSDIERRLRELRREYKSSVEVFALKPGNKSDEAKLHACFQSSWVEDEWFAISKEDAIRAFWSRPCT